MKYKLSQVVLVDTDDDGVLYRQNGDKEISDDEVIRFPDYESEHYHTVGEYRKARSLIRCGSHLETTGFCHEVFGLDSLEVEKDIEWNELVAKQKAEARVE